MPLQPFEIHAVALIWLTVAWRLAEYWVEHWAAGREVRARRPPPDRYRP